MFVEDNNFSTVVCQDAKSKVYKTEIRYNGTKTGIVEFSVDDVVYVQSLVIGIVSNVDREETFKYFFLLLAKNTGRQVCFNSTDLLVQEKRWIMDMNRQMTEEKFMLKKVA